MSEAPKPLLRVLSCGSVDDGKSTLFGRLVFECQGVARDQLAGLTRSAVAGQADCDEIDFAQLFDGLQAELEQAITIDVAYRHFHTGVRRIRVADAPGHERYTRNLVTAASTAQLAVILLDASKGWMPQTRRHSLLVHALGLRQVVLAVNKMDLVAYAQPRFEQLQAEAQALFGPLVGTQLQCIPLSGRRGDNLVSRSPRMPWYSGPTLLEHLNRVDVCSQTRPKDPMRLPVQGVNLWDSGERGLMGSLSAGTLRQGDAIQVMPSGERSRVRLLRGPDGLLESAVAADAVTVVLEDALDVGRGALLCEPTRSASVSKRLRARLAWLHHEPLICGRRYLLKLATQTLRCHVLQVLHRMDIEHLQPVSASRLEMNDLGLVDIALDAVLAFDPYEQCRDTGAFILIDMLTGQTLAGGMVQNKLDEDTPDVRWQALPVTRQARATLNGHRSAVLWLTGLSGAGKTTLAARVESALHAEGVRTYVLDGDNLRHGLCADLGFSDADRVENVRRATEAAKLLHDAGCVVIVALISPFAAERQQARDSFAAAEFFEVHVHAPLAVLEARDTKGLYRRARLGSLKGLSGVDAAYEAPEHPECRLDTSTLSVDEAAQTLLSMLKQSGALSLAAPVR
jgi:bifunctional enzyme CysN/CysC